MIDPRLEVPEALLQQLVEMQRQSASMEDMITFLQQQGLEAPRAKIALIASGVATSVQAKRAIHGSEAFAYRQQADALFETSVVDALRQMQDEERGSVAA